MYRLESILEHPHKYLLVLWDAHDDGYVKPSEEVP